MTLQAADTCSAPYRVRFDECGPDGLVRTSVLLRYTQDLAGYHSAVRGFGRDWYAEHGITWLVRAAEVAVVGAIPLNAELVGTTQVVGWRRVWARRRTEFRDAVGTLLSWVHIDWVLIDGRGAPTRIPAEFDSVFGAPPASFGLARVDARGRAVRGVADPAHGPAPGAGSDGPRQQRGLRGLARRGGPGRRWHRRPSGPCRGWPVSSTPGQPRRVPSVDAAVWPDGDAWSCRIGDDDGDLLRARLEPLETTGAAVP